MGRPGTAPGSIVGHYSVIAKSDQMQGNNRLYKVRCRLCNRGLLRTLDGMKRDHDSCFRFTREAPLRKSVNKAVA